MAEKGYRKGLDKLQTQISSISDGEDFIKGYNGVKQWLAMVR